MKKQFTKEDLKTGDIIVMKDEVNSILIGNRIKTFGQLENNGGIIDIDDYNDKLESIPYREYDIEKVYRIKDGYNYSLEQIIENLPENNVELIWERKESKREIDWSKVPPFTKVIVKDIFDTTGNTVKYRYFLKVEEVNDNNTIFFVTKCDKFTYTELEQEGASYIEIYDKKNIKEEWYK